MALSLMRCCSIWLIAWLWCQNVCVTVQAAEPDRVTRGLLALYDFRDLTSDRVADISQTGRPLDLKIIYQNGVRKSPDGLELRSKQSSLVAVSSAARMARAIQRTGEVTVEAWIRPANLKQSGPARILTLSRDASHRNLTLGQDGNKFDVRLRTTKTSDNGLPSLTSGTFSVDPQKWLHVVYTRERRGIARLYLNGRLDVEKKIGGDLSNWDPAYQFSLGDELSTGRHWQGSYRLVALYGRGLSAEEVQRNFRCGPDVAADFSTAEHSSRSRQLFVKSIAPLLVNNCLECHDAATRQGGLDLSHRKSALAGGDSGTVITPGDVEASYLWEVVQNNEMPLDRPPLSDDQKELLKQWIMGGATWTLDFVDPALYADAPVTAENWVQRLTVDEYIAAVKAVVAVDISAEARELLPADRRADGFSNTSYNLAVDFKHVEAYSKLAEIIVEKMDLAAFVRRFSKTQRFTDKDMGALIQKMGRWILRGELTEQEVIALRGISTTVASSGGSYEEASGLIIQAMLQSPRFIYRIENQVGDGTAWPAGEFELATRLSFILWGAPPDAALYEAAESGELFAAEQFDKQVQRMLEDPRALDRAKQFVSEWLNLNRLDNLQPNTERFPEWSQQLAKEMRFETLAFFEQVAWRQDRPLADLLNAQVTYLTPGLARHYNLQGSPANGRQDSGQALQPDHGSDLARYDLSQDPARGGLLTQGSVLTIGGDEASMVTRGLFVLHDLLRGVVNDPPPCVDTTPVPTEPGVTQRTVASARIKNEACGGCHAKFEPLAFGLEKFDGLGSYHERDEHGNALRDDGEVLIPGEADPIPYANARELMDLLASSERVRQSLTWKVVQFALGRPLTAEDAGQIEQIHEEAWEAGGSYRNIMQSLVRSDLVQLIRTEMPPSD